VNGINPPQSFECPKVVFVTNSADLDGALGGVAGADSKCQIRASARGLYGTYKAWITDRNGIGPANTFTQSATGYMRLDGNLVADSWEDLTDGTLDNLIIINEYGGIVGPPYTVWTNTTGDGTTHSEAFEGNADCGEWSWVGNDPTWQIGVVGICGPLGSDTQYWTEHSMITCNNGSRLYCFQQ